MPLILVLPICVATIRVQNRTFGSLRRSVPTGLPCGSELPLTSYSLYCDVTGPHTSSLDSLTSTETQISVGPGSPSVSLLLCGPPALPPLPRALSRCQVDAVRAVQWIRAGLLLPGTPAESKLLFCAPASSPSTPVHLPPPRRASSSGCGLNYSRM